MGILVDGKWCDDDLAQETGKTGEFRRADSRFRDRITADGNVRKFLDEKALAHTFDLQRQLQAVDAIFARVFGKTSSAAH